MNELALMVCKAFLNQYPEDQQAGLLQLLPERERLEIQKMETPRKLTRVALEKDWLDEFHFSWFAPYLRTLSESDSRLFIASLSEKQSRGLIKTLGIANHLPKLRKLAKDHLREKLFQALTQNQKIVPFPFLPENPLNALLDIPSQSLTRMIRYLGLHDLSFEMRQIIATKLLKKIFSALSEKEGAYLNQLLLHREPLVFKRLFLEKWDGTKEDMQKLLEKRGMNRLGHALYGAHPNLVWYISHRLDMNHAPLLIKYSAEKPSHARAKEMLNNQVDKLLKYLSTGEAAA